MKAWHEDDRFWKEMSVKLFSESQWQSAPQEVEQISFLLNLKKNQHILDLCCGPGRHSLAFARGGYRVTAVDRTVSYLEMAKKEADKENLNINFINDDMRRFTQKAAFDAVVMMYTSFGYFEDAAENRKVLDNVYQSLKKGGRLLIDLMGKEIIARVFRERDWYEKENIIYLEERQISKNWSWIDNRWIVFDGTKRFEYVLSHWIYSAFEIESTLKATGFRTVQIYGNLNGASYDQNAKRLVAVAHK